MLQDRIQKLSKRLYGHNTPSIQINITGRATTIKPQRRNTLDPRENIHVLQLHSFFDIGMRNIVPPSPNRPHATPQTELKT